MDLKNKILNILLASIPEAIKRRIITQVQSTNFQTYSQEGEDRLLERLIGEKHYGIYIDVGAHKPTFINNTYLFYCRGWRGINIDAMPGSMESFNRTRPYDINLEYAISDSDETLPFYIFNTPELNTFDETKISQFLTFPGVNLIDVIMVKTRRLSDILNSYMPKFGDTKIDFLTVDAEGWDLKVLKSNDWSKYKPKYVLAEGFFSNITDAYYSELTQFMQTVNYIMIAKTVNTVFYATNE